MDDRKLALHVAGREAVEVHPARIEIAALAAPGQVELGDRFKAAGFERVHDREIRSQAIILDHHAIGDECAVPAPDPIVIQGELAGGVDAAAKQPVTGIPVARIERREAPFVGARIGLEDARSLDRIGTVEQPVAPLGLHQQTLFRRERRRNGHVIVWRKGPEIGGLRIKPEICRIPELRGEEPGLAFHRRIGRREVGPVEQREAKHLEAGILEVDHLLGGVVDDAGCAHLPTRRLARIVLARLAGGVDAALEHRVAAVLPLGSRRGEAGPVGAFELQAVDEAVAELVCQIDDLAVHDLAVGFGEARIAFGAHALGVLLVDDLVGLQRGALVIDLDVADGEDAVVGVVVLQFVRAHEHLRVRVILAAVDCRRCGWDFRYRRNADPGRIDFGKLGGRRAHAPRHAEAHGGDERAQRHRPAVPAGKLWPGATRGHHPSS